MIPVLKKDSVWLGLVLGLLVPAVTYGVLFTVYSLFDSMGVFSDIGFAEDFRIRTLALFSICANLIFVQRYRKSYQNETIRGIMLGSMILVIVWFFIFGIKILNG